MKILLTIIVAISAFTITYGQVPSYVPTNGLVGWWPFNGNANDESGNGNNGTPTGCQLTTDRVGNSNKAYSFDGVSDYIDCGNASSVNILGDITISAWIYANNFDTDHGIVSKFPIYDFITNSNGSIPPLDKLRWSAGGNSATIFTNSISNNQWLHVVAVYNSVSGKSVYLNGILFASNPQTGTTQPNTNYKLYLGAHQPWARDNWSWNGKLDDIGIWNRSLTQSEITALYEAVLPPAITASASTITNVSCFNGSNGSATVTPNGGTSPYTYSWNSVPVQTTQTATGLKAGTYTVTVTDSKGSMTTANATITQPNSITNVNASTVINVNCFGGNNGSVTVSTPTGGTPPFTYSWNTNPVQPSQTASNLVAGTYTVTVTDSKGCTATSAATVTQPPVITNVSASTVTNVGCFGGNNGSVTVTTPTGGTPPYTYSWSTNPVQSTKTALNLIAGTYTVTVTDSKGCIATSSATVTQPAQPLSNVVAQTTQNVKCKGSSTGIVTVSNPTGGTPPYSYKWNTIPIQNSKTAENVPFGSYTVTVTDSNGCIATSTTIVTEPAPLTNVEAVVVRNVQCFGESNGSAKVTNPNGGTPPYSYSWNTIPIQTTQVASFLKAGEYVVTVTDMNGCLATSNVKITQPNIVPKPTITGEAIVCSKNTTSTFRVDSKSGYNINWSTPKNGRIIGSNSRDSVVVEWLNSGIDTVYVRYTDVQTGCFEETKKPVLIGNPLTPSIQGSASTCIDTVPVTYRTRFQAGQSYGWSKPRLGSFIGAINLDSVQIEWNASGQDTLILREFTIATGCFKDTSLIITVNPRPQPSISGKSELVEYSQSNVYSVPNESGSSYEWSIIEGDAEIEKNNGNSIELKSGKSGNVIVKVVQTTIDGCKNEAKYTITVKSATGITESRNKSFSVYPNPNNGQEELVVELPSTSLHELRIELIDLLGITRYEGMIPSETSRHVIQLSDMPQGMYTIRLIMRDGVLSEKVIVE